jgi:predicted RNase H-like HicB family nuclease
MWDEQRKLDFLLRLPWTIYSQQTPEGDTLVRVRELPSVMGTGDTEEAIERDFWDALEATLRSYLHFGDEVPLPLGLTALPWNQAAVQAVPSRRAFLVVDNEARPIDQPGTAAVERWKEKQLEKVLA